MAILGSRNSFIENEFLKTKDYTIPAVFNYDEKGMSLKKSIILSAILHPIVVGVIWLLLFCLALMGITFSIFEKPKPKINDIEFVLVDNAKEQMPLNKKTNLRSNKNTRTGGVSDKKRSISMPSPSPTRKSIQQKATPGPRVHKPSPQKNISKTSTSQNIFQKLIQSKTPQRVQPKFAQDTKPHPPSARPSLKPPSVPRPTLKQSSPFVVPIPKSSATSGKTYSTGPIGGHGPLVSGGSSSSRGTGRYAPVPSLAPSGGGSSSSGSRLSRDGSGYSGNSGGGNGSSGIDSIRDVDYSAYIKYIERKIKMNWDTPKGYESKTAVIWFKIGRNGNLISRNVRKSSGMSSYDNAAINAIELAAPFKPLPASWKKSDIEVDFTFNYNLDK